MKYLAILAIVGSLTIWLATSVGNSVAASMNQSAALIQDAGQR